MKKIFAIALALVMVLSMASAFASPCMGGFDWTCATSANKCGKGSVEVVPYVKANSACKAYEWQVSTCAGAVNSEKINYALKLTVDANADAEWWKTADLLITYKGLKATLKDYVLVDFATAWTAMESDIATNDTVGETNTFYWNTTKKAFELVTSTFEFGDANVLSEEVVDAPKAKVCATLKAENAFEAGIVGNYWVEYVKEKGAVAATKATLTYEVEDSSTRGYAVFVDGKMVSDWTIKYVDGKIVATAPEAKAETAKFGLFKFIGRDGFVPVEDAVPYAGSDAAEAASATLKVYSLKSGAKGVLLVTYTIVDGKVREIKHTNECGTDSYDTIKAFFGLEIGTCVDKDLIKANFGWKDKVEHCATWSDKAVAVVDAECVVAIPKTGDKSVLAWLF